MAQLPPLDALVRAGSGLLVLAVGAFVLFASRGRVNLALGAYLAAFGAVFLVNGVISEDTGPILGVPPLTMEVALTLPLGLVELACLPLLIGAFPRGADDPWRRRARLLALAFAAVVVVGSALARRGETFYVASVAFDAVTALSLAWLVALALGYSRAQDGAERSRLAFLAAGLLFYRAYSTGINSTFARFTLGTGYDQVIQVLSVVTLLVCIMLWLRKAAGVPGGSRLARNVALMIPAVALSGLVAGGFVAADAPDTTGGIGVARILGAACIAWAILRHDLLGIGLKPRTIRRGTLAAGSLASLFIVAQIAQNFLSAQYGLLMGGIVAGAFLFAAQPIQRAIEGRAPAPAPAPAPGATSERLETYRDAVRFALQDRHMTRREETHLARLAQELGIGAADALRVRHEVEDETTRTQ